MPRNKKLSNFLSTKSTGSKLFLILIFLISAFLLLLPVFLDIDYRALLTFGLIGLFFINFLGSATLFLPAPAIFSVALAGASFDPLTIALVAGLASALGEGVAYLFGYSSTEVLNLKRHRIIYHLSELIIHWKGGILIILFSFIPNPIFDGLGILAGLSKYPLFRFMILTFTGRVLRNIGIAYLGLFLW